MPVDIFWQDLVKSGLDYLVVAIDGVTQNVYQKYRTNGNLELALSNLKKIIKYRKEYKSNLVVEWQMIDFPWNRQQQKMARQMAKRIKCDRFRIIKEMVLERLANKNSNQSRKRGCLLPYIIFIINAYQQVRPCFKIYHEDMVVGKWQPESFDSIWNGEELKNIRDRHKIATRIGCRTCRE